MSKRSRRRNRQYNNANKVNAEMMTSMETLDAAVLERDFSYQRPVNMNRVREIVDEFDAALVNILKVSFRDTWGGDPWFVSQNMLGGMAIFYKTYVGKFNRDRFLNRLSAASRIEIQREASKHVNVPVGYQFAFAIASVYNHGGAKGTLKLNRLTINLIEEEDRYPRC